MISISRLWCVCVFFTLNRFFYPCRHPAQPVSVPILHLFLKEIHTVPRSMVLSTMICCCVHFPGCEVMFFLASDARQFLAVYGSCFALTVSGGSSGELVMFLQSEHFRVGSGLGGVWRAKQGPILFPALLD